MTGSTDLAVRDGYAPAQAAPAALAIQAGQTMWDDFQNAALNQLGLRSASNGDKAVFLHVCQRTGLDPFARQIYMIERQGKWTIQTGIDGWRVVRRRAEEREGVRAKLSRALFYDDKGDEYKVWVKAEPPVACSITLAIGDAEYTSTLMYREYVQLKDGRPMAQWASKPAHMLEKCTEADVYRKAFPQDFSGISLEDAGDGDEDAPRRPRVADDQIRARSPQRVTATVETVTPDVPPAPASPPPPEAESAGGTPGDERHKALVTAAQMHFKRLKYADAETDRQARLRDATDLVLGTEVPTVSSLNDLTHAELEDLNRVLERHKDRASLAAMLSTGEAAGDPREGGEQA